MSRLIAIVIAAFVVVALAASSLFVVDQNRYAVVYAMGELHEIITDPGLHVKLPAPLQNVVYLDKRLQTFDTPDGERFPTLEKRDVLADAFVKWKIVAPRAYLIAVGSADRGGARLAQLVRNALAAEVVKHNLPDLLAGQRADVTVAVRDRVSAAARELGVEVVDVRLKRIDLTEPVTNAVYESMKAERLRVAAETRTSGVAEAEEIRADAERQRSVIAAEGTRDAETIRGEGDAKAAAIYGASFGKNPEFYRFYRSMEAYKATFKGRNDVLVLDSNSEFFKYFKSPNPGK